LVIFAQFLVFYRYGHSSGVIGYAHILLGRNSAVDVFGYRGVIRCVGSRSRAAVGKGHRSVGIRVKVKAQRIATAGYGSGPYDIGLERRVRGASQCYITGRIGRGGAGCVISAEADIRHTLDIADPDDLCCHPHVGGYCSRHGRAEKDEGRQDWQNDNSLFHS
jgi:hypothetical protein